MNLKKVGRNVAQFALVVVALQVLVVEAHAHGSFLQKRMQQTMHDRQMRLVEDRLFLQQSRMRLGELPQSNQAPVQVRASWVSNTFMAKVNSLDANETRTFTLRYWVWDPSELPVDAPTLYYFCGEWTCSSNDGAGLTGVASRLGARMVVVEHRYYGKSQPFGMQANALSAENLKYLTTDHALVDFADLQRSLQVKNGWTGKWLVMGGSYAGSLAAYYRILYPELARAAWASSAPVRVKENFEEYELHVASVLGADCADRVRKTLAEFEIQLAQPDSGKALRASLHAEVLTDDRDVLALLSDAVFGVIQYQNPEAVCESVVAGDEQASFIRFVNDVMSSAGSSADDYRLESISSEDPADYQDSGMRQWYYQICSQYGYWQTAYSDPQVRLRSAKIDLNYSRMACEKLFGIRAGVDEAATNSRFYDVMLTSLSSGIAFVNSEYDPWSRLSIGKITGNEKVNPLNATFFVPGYSHCSDLNFLGGSDPALDAVQAGIQAQLAAWLK